MVNLKNFDKIALFLCLRLTVLIITPLLFLTPNVREAIEKLFVARFLHSEVAPESIKTNYQLFSKPS